MDISENLISVSAKNVSGYVSVSVRQKCQISVSVRQKKPWRLRALRAVSVKNGASRPRVDFVQICDCPYDLGLCEKLGKITIKIFSSHLGDHQLLRAYIGSI